MKTIFENEYIRIETGALNMIMLLSKPFVGTNVFFTKLEINDGNISIADKGRFIGTIGLGFIEKESAEEIRTFINNME